MSPKDYTLCKNCWVDDYKYYVDENGKMLANTIKEINGKTYMFSADGKYNEVTKPKSNSKQNNNTSKGTFAKYSSMATVINQYLELTYPIIREWDNTDYNTKIINKARLKQYGNIICTYCEAAFNIDKANNDTKAMEEDKYLYAAGLSMISMAR